MCIVIYAACGLRSLTLTLWATMSHYWYRFWQKIYIKDRNLLTVNAVHVMKPGRQEPFFLIFFLNGILDCYIDLSLPIFIFQSCSPALALHATQERQKDCIQCNFILGPIQRTPSQSQTQLWLYTQNSSPESEYPPASGSFSILFYVINVIIWL